MGVSCQEEPPHPEPPDDPPKPGPASSHWSPPSLGSAPQVPRGLGRPPHGTGRGQEQPSISQASRGRGQRWGVWTPAEGAPGGGLFLAPSPRPACSAPGPASSALSPFSLCPVTGTCHWPARPWDSLGGRGLCSLFLWTVKVGGRRVRGLQEGQFSFALEQRKGSPHRAAWSQTAEVTPWTPPRPPCFRAPCGGRRVPRAGPRALDVRRSTPRSRPHGPAGRRPSPETPHGTGGLGSGHP